MRLKIMAGGAMKRRLAACMIAPLLAAGALLAGGSPAQAQAEVTSELYGCPSGAVCIYRDGHPDHLSKPYITNRYWAYGAHNLVNQFGLHWVVNNQYGGPRAIAELCYGYNGTRCDSTDLHPGGAVIANLTPINSIVLHRP